MKFAPRVALAVWLVLLAACVGWLVRNLTIGADLTVFLPPSTNSAQRLLMDQLRNGVSSRLIFIALEGAEASTLPRASRDLAQRLRASGLFGVVNNGDLAGAAR